MLVCSHDMKTLELTFVMNADKCGNHTFTQTRREGNFCIYRRNRVSDGTVHSYEVFITRLIKAGTPLPGGNFVAEDYEQYPGANAFGRTAWSYSGTHAEQAAKKTFDRIKAKKEQPEVEIETEGTVTVIPVARVSKSKVTLKLPDKPFTQKDLAAFNNITNYKEVYAPLQAMLADKTLRQAGTKETTRGKAAKLFAIA